MEQEAFSANDCENDVYSLDEGQLDDINSELRKLQSARRKCKSKSARVSQKRRLHHKQEARDLQNDRSMRYRASASKMARTRRERASKRMGTTTTNSEKTVDFRVGMRVRLFHEGRVYGIGWGPRDLEYRRTVVTVHHIDSDDVVFLITGLRSHKEGYYVTLSKDNAQMHAMCLNAWCTNHPEDAQS